MRGSGKKIKLNIDAPLIIAVVSLLIIGILSIYSANIMKPRYHSKYLKQLVALILGLILFFVFMWVEYHRYSDMWLLLYGISIVLLLITYIFARRIHGAKSWIFIAGQGFQPSEFVKILTIIWLARYLDQIKKRVHELKYFVFSLFFTLPVVGLILMQPDFGTALVYFPIILTMMYVAGADKKHLIVLIGVALIGIGIPLITFYFGEVLKVKSSLVKIMNKSSVMFMVSFILFAVAGVCYVLHKRFKDKILRAAMLITLCLSLGFTVSIAAKSFLQKHHYSRFLAFIDTDRIDPRGAGWNINQSLTAIGAGGFTGQGFLNGNQKNGGFLPAQDTDFIFSVIAEEWGFVGAIVIIILYLVIIYRGINVIFNAKDMIGSLIATGITSMFFFHILINIGMAAGIMPVMGLPLPFLSSGGSFLLTCMMAVGLLLNIELRRYVY